MPAHPDTTFPPRQSPRPAATHATAPPWRALAGLGAAVIAVHALVLQTTPARWGPGRDAVPADVRPLIMRRIEAPPAPAAARREPAALAPVPGSPAAASPPPVRPRPPRASPPRASPPRASPPRASPPAASVTPPEAPAPDPVAATEPPEAIAPSGPQEPPEPALPLPQASASAPANPEPNAPAPAPAPAMALPANTRLTYEATGLSKGLTYYARSELDWRQTDGQYEARIRISALFLGSRSMTSSGTVDASGLAPRRFADQSRAEQAAHFEPDRGQISFSANTPSVPWVPGAQDRVTIFLQLGGMLAGQPGAFPPGTSISIYTVGPRDGQTWTFEVGGEETLRLPFGELSALKLTRQPRRDYDQKVEVWYAPALGYLPVRNKITQHSGDFVDQQLSKHAPY